MVFSLQELSKLLKEGLKAVLESSNIILQIYNSDFNIETKSDYSPVTEADKKANAYIEEALSHLNIPLIGEEGLLPEYQTRKDYPHFWLLDPIDGTKEFIKRNGEFTVNLALIQNHEPILGIIYAPVFKDLYFAIKNIGSFKLDRHKHIEMGFLANYSLEEIIRNAMRLPIQNASRPFTVIASRSHLDDTTSRWIKSKKMDYPEMDILYCGSSLKMCKVAEGSADVYPRFGRSNEWDTAAGQIIVEEAGGEFLNYETGKRLAYNKNSLENPWFIVQGNLIKQS
jgi:3'(2'), 5'-bisphosphate nucleotidase